LQGYCRLDSPIQFLDIPTPESVAKAGPRLTFDPEWLAITRVFHPYLTTSDVDVKLSDLPASDILQAQIAAELEKIKKDGILVPSLLEGRITEEPPLAPVRGPVEIIRVQQFSRTAPTQGQPGGNPRVWYTNPQTEAFCAMLGLDNKVNPRCK
jgi:lariat debranching enzyme